MEKTVIITELSGNSRNQFVQALSPETLNLDQENQDNHSPSGSCFFAKLTPELSRFCSTHQDFQLIAFCISPGAFLAALTNISNKTSLEAALDRWCEEAENLLKIWRKYRSRVNVINLDECFAWPQEFFEWFQKIVPHHVKPQFSEIKHSKGNFEALRSVVCEGVGKEHRLATRLWRELLAACQQISSEFQGEQSLSDASGALLSLVEAQEAQTAILGAIDTLTAERTALANRLASISTERDSLAEVVQKQKEEAIQTHEMLLCEIQKAFQESESFFTQMEASRAEVEDLKSVLELTHNEFQATHTSLLIERDTLTSELVKQKEEATQTHEMLLCEIQKAFQESEGFFTQMESARAEVEDLKSNLEFIRTEFQTTHTSLLIERDTLTSELVKQKEEATQNHEMLLTAIQSAHLESEKFYEEWKTLEAATDFHPLKVCAVSGGNEIISPPHCHLDFSFERLELFDRRWPRLAVRLVEHNGHAGLVVFDTPTEKNRPLFHWNPTGQENGIAYMLFVPNDKPALDRLVALPATDLILLRCIIAKILGHLSVRGTPPGVLWPSVARRLLQQIEEIPERLHYDSIVAAPAFGATGKAIDFTANLLFFRGDVIERFRWTWIPRSRGGEIVLKKTMGGRCLLLGWPSDQETICIGAENSEAVNRTRNVWNQFLQRDRTFLHLIVAAMPDFIFHFCAQHPTSDREQKDLLRQAQTLCQKLDELSQTKRRRIMAARIFAL